MNCCANRAKFLVCATAIVLGLGFAVQLLWNWLLPPLIGASTISFFQAVGLLILSKILFGGFRGHCGHGNWRQRLFERWEKMTPDEREKFKSGLGCCGIFGGKSDAPDEKE